MTRRANLESRFSSPHGSEIPGISFAFHDKAMFPGIHAGCINNHGLQHGVSGLWDCSRYKALSICYDYMIHLQ